MYITKETFKRKMSIVWSVAFILFLLFVKHFGQLLLFLIVLYHLSAGTKILWTDKSMKNVRWCRYWTDIISVPCMSDLWYMMAWASCSLSSGDEADDLSVERWRKECLLRPTLVVFPLAVHRPAAKVSGKRGAPWILPAPPAGLGRQSDREGNKSLEWWSWYLCHRIMVKGII